MTSMPHRLFFALLLLLLAVASRVSAQPRPHSSRGPTEKMPDDQPRMLLWPSGAPDAKGNEPADQPWIWLYPAPAEKANGTAVVVCPGGGYGNLAIHHEGHEVARWLNQRGVSAFVLKYRHAPSYRHPTPWRDAQRALRLVRSRAADWNIDPQRVGIWGFSAGGHLASTAATQFDQGRTETTDPVDAESCRPDFAILCYPVIAMDDEPFLHAGSRRNLLGDDPDPALAASLSSDRRVTAETPPTFLFHTGEDTGVPVENSLAFYRALRAAQVPAELHVYEHGRHGVGLAQGDPILATWPARLHDWLTLHGLLGSNEPPRPVPRPSRP